MALTFEGHLHNRGCRRYVNGYQPETHRRSIIRLGFTSSENANPHVCFLCLCEAFESIHVDRVFKCRALQLFDDIQRLLECPRLVKLLLRGSSLIQHLSSNILNALIRCRLSSTSTLSDRMIQLSKIILDLQIQFVLSYCEESNEALLRLCEFYLRNLASLYQEIERRNFLSSRLLELLLQLVESTNSQPKLSKALLRFCQINEGTQNFLSNLLQGNLHDPGTSRPDVIATLKILEYFLVHGQMLQRLRGEFAKDLLNILSTNTNDGVRLWCLKCLSLVYYTRSEEERKELVNDELLLSTLCRVTKTALLSSKDAHLRLELVRLLFKFIPTLTYHLIDNGVCEYLLESLNQGNKKDSPQFHPDRLFIMIILKEFATHCPRKFELHLLGYGLDIILSTVKRDVGLVYPNEVQVDMPCKPSVLPLHLLHGILSSNVCLIGLSKAKLMPQISGTLIDIAKGRVTSHGSSLKVDNFFDFEREASYLPLFPYASLHSRSLIFCFRLLYSIKMKEKQKDGPREEMREEIKCKQYS
ncbi:hypothetical protein AAMO2058_000677700 [Amorphochlora amoebiformis]